MNFLERAQADRERLLKVKKSQATEFRSVTTALKAFERKAADGSTEYILEGVASSTVVDRSGDFMGTRAMTSMLKSLGSMTVFGNHSYSVPEDVFGLTSEPELREAVDGEQGPCVDLAVKIRVLASNPRAMQTYQAIKDGALLGLSIGGYILEWNYDENREAFEIVDIELLELSIVGIPANQRAMIESIAKGVRLKAAAAQLVAVKGAPDMLAAFEMLKGAKVTMPLAKGDNVEQARALLVEYRKAADAIAALPESGVIVMSSEDPTAEPGATLVGENPPAGDPAEPPHEPVAGEATCASAAGCVEKNVGGSILCQEHQDLATLAAAIAPQSDVLTNGVTSGADGSGVTANPPAMETASDPTEPPAGPSPAEPVTPAPAEPPAAAPAAETISGDAATIANLQGQLSAKDAEITRLQAALETAIAGERDATAKAARAHTDLETLKQTRTGRATAQSTGSAGHTSRATNDPNFRRMDSDANIRADMERSLAAGASGATDGRSLSLT